MKNAFYFTSKAIFVLKVFKFLSWLSGHVAKRSDKKDKVNFKFYDVTAWLPNNRNNILLNILRSKGNQTIKFGHLIGCNMRNNFLEKLYTKCDGETSPRHFLWKIKIELWISV